MPNPVTLLKRFRREERGSAATVEVALWLPIFMMFLMLVIDVSSIYNQQSQIIRIVQDVNRAYAVGKFDSDSDVEAFIETAIAGYTTKATIDVDTVTTPGLIQTTVDIPATELMPVNRFAPFRNATVSVAAQQLSEF